MKTRPFKLFVVRKYVYAQSAVDAIRREKKIPIDDVWVDEEWKKLQPPPTKAIGFKS